MAVNKVILLGNVGRDPEVRRMDDGTVCATFPLATSERAYRKRTGEEVPEKTEWHNIVAWQGVAERIERQVHKGSLVYLEGKLRTRQWIDPNNVRHYVTEIFVDQFELLKSPTLAPNPADDKPEESQV
ncbi:MAG: single-stranded DNA-binding protein [Bacteroidales bacterium]|nr:single-stranded DNA-binding protein [Bacteroidales bacterium]